MRGGERGGSKQRQPATRHRLNGSRVLPAFEQRLIERCRLQHARSASRDWNLPLKLPVAFDEFTQLRQSRERRWKQIATQEEVEECGVVVTDRLGLPGANRVLQSVGITQRQFVGG